MPMWHLQDKPQFKVGNKNKLYRVSYYGLKDIFSFEITSKADFI